MGSMNMRLRNGYHIILSGSGKFATLFHREVLVATWHFTWDSPDVVNPFWYERFKP